MDYPREFFDLTYRFAQRIHCVTGLALDQALLRYTHLYLAFGLGRSFDPSVADWAAFIAGLRNAADPVDWMYATYRRLVGYLPPRQPDLPFGCFSYAVWAGGRVRLHFWNPERGVSPLRREFIPTRMAELRDLFTHVRATVPGASKVVGGSWLYNIEAYRRLFPEAFLSTARAEEPEAQFIALWGQFVDHRRQIKTDMAAAFLQRVGRAASLDEILRSFPYLVLRLEACIESFYTFYGV